ncbi:uncharacterized protein Flash [Anoplolepis gracilipes]|uniref:uncharacterized protein Flash n=1 Tax=Anoplolepis gracilipes TaxID=354296 RepID=UPI003BA2F756
MEDDIDIYADLPESFNLNPDKNDQICCNCEKLKNELSLLSSKLENIQKINETLEKNLSSLLKTAKGEIARKDKMISDLRKRLDDTAFRRNNKGDFSTHRSYHLHTTVEKYEDVPLMQSQEYETVLHETELHETEFQHNEHRNKKSQYDGQLPTVFAERLHKRIMKDEKEDTKQKTSLKLVIEANSKEIFEENIVESDKENGSQSIMNNNESNTITQHCDSGNSHTKNSGKRMNEEDSTHGNKRLKIDDSEGKSASDETNYDSTVQYELKENLAQYEMKHNLAQFEDRLNAVHHFKEEEISLNKRRASSEHQDIVRQNRDCTNGWKREERSTSRIASTSNYLEEPNNAYKKSSYRYNSPRSYSRSRSDYESSSSHRLRERSNRTYRNNRKYDDYKYDNQYRTKRDYRLKRDYESIENESKTRHRSRERDDVAWDKSRHLSSDVEDKEGNSSYKNKRYEGYRIKEPAAKVLHNKDVHERDKTAAKIDFRASSSRTIVNNTVNHSTKKITEQEKVKKKSNIKSINLTKSTSTYVAANNLSNLEEGEIVDSPEKKIGTNSVQIFKDHRMVENETKILLIKDKNKEVPVIASITDNDKSIPLQNDVITLKQLDNVTEIDTKVKVTLCLEHTTLKNPEKITELNSHGKNDTIVDEVRNCKNVEDIFKSQCNEDVIDSTTCIIEMIEQVCDSNVDNDDKSHVEEELKTSITETAIKINEMTDSNIKSATESKRIDDSNVESAINKDKVNNSTESPVKIAKSNNSDNSTSKIDDKELKSSTAEVTEKVEAVPNCDIENGDANQVSIESKTSRRTSGKSNVEISHLCLSDHNYVQDPPLVTIFHPDVTRESPVRDPGCETVPKVTTEEQTKVDEKLDVSLTAKKTLSSTIKNKKNQQNKGIVISRRLRAVTLSDSNASMTVLMNTKTSSNISNSNNESVSKPRACKASRACK